MANLVEVTCPPGCTWGNPEICREDGEEVTCPYRVPAITHQGLREYRTRMDGNELERAFALEWERENALRPSAGALLQDLLRGHKEEGIAVTQEIATAVATIIQWQGSPVGFSFLVQALERAGYYLVRKERAE